MVGYIDADTHVVECEHTWDFFEPSEAQFKPVIDDGYWKWEERCKRWPGPATSHWIDVFPAGSVDLSDPSARVRYMDDLGVDVQVLFPTFWLADRVTNVVREAAMARSYNRWLAEATSDSGGRLGWAACVPVRATDRALEELEFGKAHGALSAFVLGQNWEMSLADPSMFPIYAKAQDLDLAVTAHTGGDMRTFGMHPGNWLHSAVMTVPGALHALIVGRLAERFPNLRWGFLEAGASWLPFVLQEAFRADETAKLRSFRDWRLSACEILHGSSFFTACQMDDDLPYLLEFTGPDNMLHGTDFGHLDLGSDPNGLHIVANRDDVDPAIAHKIVDDNARRLYGIDPSFQPAPRATTEGLVLSPGSAGTIQ